MYSSPCKISQFSADLVCCGRVENAEIVSVCRSEYEDFVEPLLYGR